MQERSISKEDRTSRFSIFVLFLICGLLVFFINMTFTGMIPQKIRIASKLGLIVIFLAAAITFSRHKRFNKFWKVFFAFFAASFALFVSLHLSKWGLRISHLEIDTLSGLTLYKLLEDLIIVFAIIILVKISKDDMASLFLTKGNLRLGLIIGLVSFFGLFLLSFLQAMSQNISLAKYLSLLPSLLMIPLADGFMEELLFRGLFLKRFTSFMGVRLSILLTTLIYMLTHIQVTFMANLPIFLFFTFLFGLLWGYIMYKTGSLLGPALFHAGVDTLIMMDFLAGFGVIQ